MDGIATSDMKMKDVKTFNVMQDIVISDTPETACAYLSSKISLANLARCALLTTM